ncbi:G-protein-signaling modulator 2-like [Anarrhichthys ocellatus]|uniref:G-protein-signaling modulator 2-like n=1 Tax=Anarrhichthys ocellatus TaxID=433405 RepID=UPI0012EE5D81|nr:G-protein-signaling modulator 2-like [Anarrhichthys ocellatus]XP_031696610.1 G-protein-signaling modulator 2-like [Anarrhichthys ocellatus]
MCRTEVVTAVGPHLAPPTDDSSAFSPAHSPIMADRKLSGVAPPSLSSPSHQNGRIRGKAPKCSPPPHRNGSLETRPRHDSPSNTSTRTSASTSPLRTLRGLMTPVPSPGPGGSHGSTRPRIQSLGSTLSSRTRTMTSTIKRGSSQPEEPEEPEALLDLILECQAQRLEVQRASLSLLPDPGPASPCGACSPEQPTSPSPDFYYMLIHYQSDRMEDQRCSLPDLDDVVGPVPEDQQDLFSLIQRVQSRRMDEQRASLLPMPSEDHINIHHPQNHQ